MPIIKCQVRLPYFTNLPKDVATNTLYYNVPGSPPASAALDDVAAMIEGFYTTIDDFLASVILRSADACSIRMYDLSDPEPRQPIRIETFTLGPPLAAGNMPLECAAVLSYYSAFSSGVPNARRRGRIYIGPLYANALTAGSSSVFPSLSTGVVNGIVAAVGTLSSITTNGAEWTQYSPTADLGFPVLGGWMDTEFDTQRRREANPAARVTFTV